MLKCFEEFSNATAIVFTMAEVEEHRIIGSGEMTVCYCPSDITIWANEHASFRLGLPDSRVSYRLYRGILTYEEDNR